MDLRDEVTRVLERRKHPADLPVLDELVESYRLNDRNNSLKITRYKVSGAVLLLAIPIISSTVSFAVNMTDTAHFQAPVSWLRGSVPLLSLVLTLLTVLNSVLKPSARFSRCCRIGVELFHWRCALLEDLEQVDLGDERHLLACLAEHRKALRKIQESQINLALPEQA
jgi:hypothetical protein